VEVAERELDTLGCNVLAVAPRICLMVEGNPETRRALEREGVEVHLFEAGEICLKGAGGPTCLTRPLERGD
jgi:N-dimethylarginine dimethylaminohydrolase